MSFLPFFKKKKKCDKLKFDINIHNVEALVVNNNEPLCVSFIRGKKLYSTRVEVCEANGKCIWNEWLSFVSTMYYSKHVDSMYRAKVFIIRVSSADNDNKNNKMKINYQCEIDLANYTNDLMTLSLPLINKTRSASKPLPNSSTYPSIKLTIKCTSLDAHRQYDSLHNLHENSVISSVFDSEIPSNEGSELSLSDAQMRLPPPGAEPSKLEISTRHALRTFRNNNSNNNSNSNLNNDRQGSIGSIEYSDSDLGYPFSTHSSIHRNSSSPYPQLQQQQTQQVEEPQEFSILNTLQIKQTPDSETPTARTSNLVNRVLKDYKESVSTSKISIDTVSNKMNHNSSSHVNLDNKSNNSININVNNNNNNNNNQLNRTLTVTSIATTTSNYSIDDNVKDENKELPIDIIGKELIKKYYTDANSYRFWNGIPIVSCIVMRCLFHWKIFEKDQTNDANIIIREISRLFHDVSKLIYDKLDNLSYAITNSILILHILKSIMEDNINNAWLPKKNIDDTIIHKFDSDISAFAVRSYHSLIRRCLREFTKVDFSQILSENEQESDACVRSICRLYIDFYNIFKKQFLPRYIQHQIMSRIFSFCNAQIVNTTLQRRDGLNIDSGMRLQLVCSTLLQFCYDNLGGNEIRQICQNEFKSTSQIALLAILDLRSMENIDELLCICPALNVLQIENIVSNLEIGNTLLDQIRDQVVEKSVNQSMYLNPYQEAAIDVHCKMGEFLLDDIPIPANISNHEEFQFLHHHTSEQT